ncbi:MULTISPECIES: hydroxymethylglutaryl-CoA lyase [unclassified Streptomyces]|uniref:hydroxymethylglutaryl-CoA lyase n=1 Tax=unclassified Streptomyces TaxID=2593676 RepID=UPI002DD7E798|nr:hydroxymethylglutaryl-CoA lyase [Streptomyces sp. NBC_01775]WSB78986.1 hydroxymethylglutaryl-CoA lyase [Streptomyces sp. NBC_01775]WSS41597.1 hydroxymethylglutaryl-CoA lyase [Streptomyces sp. NBC_01187]
MTGAGSGAGSGPGDGSGLPMAFPVEGLPARVRIHEVGPRDGLQNEKTVVPVEVKAEFIRRLVAAGLRTVEATSFVHPKWVPQLADAEELYPLVSGLRDADHPSGPATPAGSDSSDSSDQLDGPARVSLPVLVPNDRGLERALALGARQVAVFASATESFARANLNRTVDGALEMFEPVVARAKKERLTVRGYLSMCFGDPWEGPVPVAQVVRVCKALAEMGCDELSLGDTIGVATPGHVSALLSALHEAGLPASGTGLGSGAGPAQGATPGAAPATAPGATPSAAPSVPSGTPRLPPGTPRLAVHFHDTYGQALSNTLAALQHGVTTVDASAGGLGGCPYARSATGNLATEDLVWMLRGLGIETGVDLDLLSSTSLWMAERLGRPSPSRTVRALSGTASPKEK